MSNYEVASAVEMVVNEEFEKYNYTIEEVTDSDIEELTDRILSIDTMIPHDIMVQIEKFRMQFDSSWNVYLMFTKTEVCGLIAFTDWT
jgi:hypothetical protein